MGENCDLPAHPAALARRTPKAAFFPPFSRALSAIFLLLLALLWSGIHLQIDSERESQRRHAERDLGNLTRTVAEQIRASVRGFDLALLTLREEWQRAPADFPLAVRRQQAHVLGRISFQVAIIDARGLLAFSNLARPAGGAPPSLADREHFRVHTGGGDRLFISTPIFGRVSQRWSIQFTRPILDRNGAFAGVIVLSVDPEHFAAQFDSIDLGGKGIVSLLRAEGHLLARSPRLEKAIGQQTANLPFQAGDALEAGRYQGSSQIDGVERLVSWRRLPDLGLVVLTGRSISDIFATPELNRRRFITGGSVATFILLTLYFISLAVLRQRSAAAAALATSEARLRILIEMLPDQVWMKDPQGSFLVCNPAFEKMMQTDAADILGRACQDLVGPEQAARFRAHDQAAVEAGRAVTREEWMSRPDGSRILLETTKVPVRVDGELLGVLAVARDITARKQAEAALLQSNADLEQFAYSVSHDMRQPLRMVSGHLQLLARSLGDRLDADSRENLNFALDGARRMDAMIVSLLDYSRVGRKTESKRWLDSRDVLDEALDFLAPAIADSDAAIGIEGDWPRIFASRDEISRLLQNLLGNALKYRAPGQAPRVEIRSQATAAQGGAPRWRLSVRDHGVGIDPGQIDRLFQFFSRLQPHARFEGCGMGLALCRRIAEHHGGSIRAESAGEGEGSTFVVEIPLPGAGA